MKNLLLFFLSIIALSSCAVVVVGDKKTPHQEKPTQTEQAYQYNTETDTEIPTVSEYAPAPNEYSTGVRPDQQPLKLYTSPANWEFYSQKGGTPLRRANADTVGRMFRPDVLKYTAFVSPCGNPDTMKNRFVVTPNDSVFYVNFYGCSLFIANQNASTGKGGIYAGSDTVPSKVQATLTNSILFRGDNDFTDNDAPFKIRADGNEPKLLAFISNGDSAIFSRSDFEFMFFIGPKYVVQSNQNIVLIADSLNVQGNTFFEDTVKVRSTFIITQPENSATAGIILNNQQETGSGYFAVTEDGDLVIGTQVFGGTVVMSGGNATFQGNLTVFNNTNVSGTLRESTNVTTTSSATLTLSSGKVTTVYFPAADKATLTINMLASPTTGDVCEIVFRRNVAAITWSGNGNSIPLAFPTSAVIGDYFRFKFIATFGWVKL